MRREVAMSPRRNFGEPFETQFSAFLETHDLGKVLKLWVVAHWTVHARQNVDLAERRALELITTSEQAHAVQVAVMQVGKGLSLDHVRFAARLMTCAEERALSFERTIIRLLAAA